MLRIKLKKVSQTEFRCQNTRCNIQLTNFQAALILKAEFRCQNTRYKI